MRLSTVPQRIAALRDALRARALAACIVPTADPHLSEYLPAHWKAREWLSGFTGSAGTLIVTADFAGLWTDSRYFSQAERQLAGSGIELVRLVIPDPLEWLEWLGTCLTMGAIAACAPDMLSLAQERAVRARLEPRGARLNLEDVTARIWEERPPLPAARIFEHPLEYALRTRAEKLHAVRASMRAAGATCHLVSALDEIAWVLNLRGSDVEYNPVFLAHLLIGEREATLFVDAARMDAALQRQLQQGGVKLAPYASVSSVLGQLPKDAT
ncbi:MAG: aminopeptidase P family N-terminal domain-containing protein, partial [Gammaproteobacteria bacterium]|nr:aminopeptidase P family N-terminal domain-containing protein [Gammaproteobacteria bacterium]